jgi:two-component system, sensor histidine kinase
MNSIQFRNLIRPRQRELSETSVHVLGAMRIATPNSRDASALSILVVDDCPLQNLLSSVRLSQWGIRPQLASDGVEAVLLACEQQFDLILMDIHMPVLDGVVATARIRKDEHRRGADQVPIVAYTAEPLPANQRAWAGAGFTAFLAKPCGIEELGDCLKYWCGLHAEPIQH